jgi:hypothetical protein
MPRSRSRSSGRDDTTSSASSGRSRSRSSGSVPGKIVKLAQIFIIKLDPFTKNVMTAVPWDGRRPGPGDILLAYGVKISNNTYDAYIPIDGLVGKKLDRLKRHKGSIRSASPNRGFQTHVGEHPNGVPFSYLHGNTATRKFPPYETIDSIFGHKETLEPLLLDKIMTKESRHEWRKDDFRIYVLTERATGVEGCTSSCWYLVNGSDTPDIGGRYIREVKKSKLSPVIGSLEEKYCILDKFLVGDACSYCFNRELGRHTGMRIFGKSSRNKPNSVGGGKSHRKLKRRFKRKTIKRRFKKR